MKKEADFEENKPLNFNLTSVTHQQNQSFTLSLKKSTDIARCVTEFNNQCCQLLSSDEKRGLCISTIHSEFINFYKKNPNPSFSFEIPMYIGKVANTYVIGNATFMINENSSKSKWETLFNLMKEGKCR